MRLNLPRIVFGAYVLVVTIGISYALSTTLSFFGTAITLVMSIALLVAVIIGLKRHGHIGWRGLTLSMLEDGLGITMFSAALHSAAVIGVGLQLWNTKVHSIFPACLISYGLFVVVISVAKTPALSRKVSETG